VRLTKGRSLEGKLKDARRTERDQEIQQDRNSLIQEGADIDADTIALRDRFDAFEEHAAALSFAYLSNRSHLTNHHRDHIDSARKTFARCEFGL
jgi:hypothetical protein